MAVRSPSSGSAELFTLEHVGPVCVLTILARTLDAHAADELHRRLIILLDTAPAPRFVLDFCHVHFMGSPCIGALVAFLKALGPRDGKLALANVSGNVRFLFTLTRLDRVFPICHDVPTALAAVEGPP